MTGVLAASIWQRAGLESLVLTLLIAVVLSWVVWRWRRSGTVMRCVMVSLLAHLLLLLYACRIQWGPAWQGGEGGLLTIRLRDDPDEPLAPSSAPQEAQDASALAPHAASRDDLAAAKSPAAQESREEASSRDEEPVPEAAAHKPVEADAPIAKSEPTSEASRTSREPHEPSQPLPAAAEIASVQTPPKADTEPATTAADAGAAGSKHVALDPPPPAEPSTAAALQSVSEGASLPPAFPFEPLPASSWMPRTAATPPPTAAPLPHDALPPEPLTPQSQLAATRPEKAVVPLVLQARLAGDRLAVAQGWGATPQSEAAVAAALDWLARTQSPDGRWNAAAFGAGRETRTLGHDRQGAGARADTGITALALLAFLGTGQTHLSGPHQGVVRQGLAFLVASQAADGSLAGSAELFAAMYCHGMASLALAEAYALTGDPQLYPPLRRALDYTLVAQHVGGGWRYQPHDPGDMSQFGWQVMALKAGGLGGLSIPPAADQRMRRFLRSCAAGVQGGLASYRPGERPSRTMTAEALVCRWLLDEALPPGATAEATGFLLEELPGQGPANFYYWYYGTLALFPQQGPAWQRWNAALQRELIQRQRSDGWMAGSWDPTDLWGGYGGRVYSTALAALCLEVYYRYLPQEGTAPPSRLTDRLLVPPVPR